MLTLVSSASRSDLDVWYYVKDVLDALLAGETNYERLLPWTWKESHPERVREHRVIERKERTRSAEKQHRPGECRRSTMRRRSGPCGSARCRRREMS